ncbi:MAG TPA: polysaccharide deacetylase family protein [Ktedonobacteraceae bacterium]
MDLITRHESQRRRMRLAKILLVTSILSIVVAGGLSAYLLFFTSTPTPNVHVLAKQEPQTITNNPDIDAFKTIANQYMKDGIQGDFAQDWSLLDPSLRTLWPNQQAFTTFWQAHFQNYTLKGFSLGKVSQLPIWVNPETMIQYTNVLKIGISLQIELKPGLSQAQLAPEALHPAQLLQNIPLIAEQTTNTGKTWLVVEGGPFDLEAPILPPVQPVTTTVQVPIPMFHHIADVPATDALTQSLEVAPTLFTQQMDYLKTQGYHTITFNQLFNALYYAGPLPKKPIILTFDDSYDDAYKFAYPILKAHGFSGMFYIITGKIGWQGQMTWGQMYTMLQNGMQMGSHTIHHVDMGQVLNESVVQAQQELQISQLALQRRFGIPIQQFCYPAGEPFNHGTLAEQQQIVSLLAQDGYIGATTDPGVTGTTQDSTTPFQLLRIRVDGRSSLQEFEGSMPW